MPPERKEKEVVEEPFASPRYEDKLWWVRFFPSGVQLCADSQSHAEGQCYWINQAVRDYLSAAKSQEGK